MHHPVGHATEPLNQLRPQVLGPLAQQVQDLAAHDLRRHPVGVAAEVQGGDRLAVPAAQRYRDGLETGLDVVGHVAVAVRAETASPAVI